MDDSLKTLDLSAEGTVSVPPVVPTPPTAPLGASTPPPAPQPTIVTQSSGPTDKKPMGKKTKIVAGVLSVLVLLSGLGVGIFLSKQKQLSAIKAGGPNICTWETCGDDPNKWAAGAAAAEGKAQENPAVAAQVQEIVNTAINTNDNGSVGNQVDHIEAVLNTNLDQQEKQALGSILTTTQQQALSGALAPVTVTSGPTLSDGVGGVKADAQYRTGACGQCGGLNQGGCDNMPTSYEGKSGPACGFGCLGGLYFCTSSGSCQASCPDGKISAGPLDSNQNIKNCLLTGKDCGTGNAIGFTQASLVAASGGTSTSQTSQQALADAIKKYDSKTCGISCNAWDGKPFCLSDAPGGVAGNPGGCNAALVAMSGQNNSWGGIAQSSKVNCLTSTCPYISPSVVNGKVTWDQTQLCLIFPTVCNGDKSKFGSLIWDFNTKSFDQASLNTLLALIRKTDPTVQLNLWSCPAGTSTWGQGCNSGNPTSGASSMSTSYCGIQQIDIDGGGGHISVNFANANCGGTPTTPTTTTTGGNLPPYTPPGGGSNPTPTPTTTTQSYACYQLSIMKNGNNISAASVQVGDSLVMRGFATATNTTVSKMRFIVSINGVAQAPVDVNASLISGMYQADMPYTITQAASYSVTTAPISP